MMDGLFGLFGHHNVDNLDELHQDNYSLSGINGLDGDNGIAFTGDMNLQEHIPQDFSNSYDIYEINDPSHEISGIDNTNHTDLEHNTIDSCENLPDYDMINTTHHITPEHLSGQNEKISFGGYYRSDGLYHYSSDDTNRDEDNHVISFGDD